MFNFKFSRLKITEIALEVKGQGHGHQKLSLLTFTITHIFTRLHHGDLA